MRKLQHLFFILFVGVSVGMFLGCACSRCEIFFRRWDIWCGIGIWENVIFVRTEQKFGNCIQQKTEHTIGFVRSAGMKEETS